MDEKETRGLEEQVKSYELEDIRNLGQNIGHSIKVVGKKTAMFTERVKNAISSNYHKAVNAMRSAKDAVKGKLTDIKDGATNMVVHAMNSIDMNTYHMNQEGYQKIMSNKTAKLDEKIEKVQNKISAIKNAEVGFGRNQVLDEKDRSYLLHKNSDLLNKLVNEKATIGKEMEQLENYEKGQNERIKIAGKRRIKMAMLDLKRISTNVLKATAAAAVKVVSVPGKIKNAASNSMSKMAERIAERKQMKADKKEQERIANMTPEEKIAEFVTDDAKASFLGKVASIKERKLSNIYAFLDNALQLQEEEEMLKSENAEDYEQANTLLTTGFQNDLETGLMDLYDNNVVNTLEMFEANPEYAADGMKKYNEDEQTKKDKDASDLDKKLAAAREEGRKEAEDKYAKQFAEMQKQIDELKKANEKSDKSKKDTEEKTDLSKMTKAQLVELATHIKGAASMKKADLINALDNSEKSK